MPDLGPSAVDPANVEQMRAWDGGAGAFWAANARRYDLAMAGYNGPFLDAAAVSTTARVLDIGCGTGQTTRDAARLATAGSALGVDLSAAMLDVARRLATAEGLANLAFLHADAQVHAFAENAFDLAVSRTGAMFFGDPEAAFANVAQALRPGGRLVLLVWQPVARQEWFVSLATALAAGRPLRVPAPDAPGPFSLGDPNRIRALLSSTGFDGCRLDDLSQPMVFGSDADDASPFVLGQLGWMLDGLDAAGLDRARAALSSTLRAHEGGGGVAFDSATWLVTAQRR